MEEIMAYRAELLSALESVVNELARLAFELPSHSWDQPFSPDGRSPHYVLYQLRAWEAHFYTIQLRRMLAEENIMLPLFDDSAWMAPHYNPAESPGEIINEIWALRQQELGWLRKLSPQEWSRTGRHPWWGAHTLQWWVEQQLEYSRQVVKQLAAGGELQTGE